MVRFVSIFAATLIMSFLYSSSLKAEVYKWVDENGKTHYSDRPVKSADSEWVEDSGLITYSKQPARRIKTKKYRSLTIPKSSPKSVQQPKPTRVEGSSSSRSYARGSSSSRY